MKSALKETVGFESMIRERRSIFDIPLIELAKVLHVCDVCEISMDELKAFVSRNITANV